MPQYGLSTAANWWPARLSIPPSVNEQECTMPQQKQNGLACISCLHGYTSSSTRAELLGVLTALLAPIP
eukprot:2998799-Karenia_brevis.AAC.1